MLNNKIRLKKLHLELHLNLQLKKQALIIYSFFVNNKLKNMGCTAVACLSINNCDFYSQEPISRISVPYLYCIEDYGEIYSFDIRTLQQLYQSSRNNPYTGNVLNETVWIGIFKKMHFLEMLGFPISYEPVTRIIPDINDIIYKLHMLDFDIKRQWFEDISLANIKKIYLECYSRYKRASKTIRYNINTKCDIFGEFSSKKNLKDYLSTIIHHNAGITILFLLLDKFISDGKNKEYKKIGAMYFLQATLKHGKSAPLSNAFFYLQ